MPQNLVNWSLTVGAEEGRERETQLEASALQMILVFHLNLQLKRVPGGCRNCLAHILGLSPNRHYYFHSCILYVAFMSSLLLSITSVCVGCGALLRGLCLPPLPSLQSTFSSLQLDSGNGVGQWGQAIPRCELEGGEGRRDT